MARAKKASKVGAAAPKKVPEKPFFRPFSELGKQAKRAADEGANEAARGEKGGAAPRGAGASPPGPPPILPTKRPVESAPAGRPAMSASDGETFAIYMAGVDALPRGKDRIPATAAAIERSASPNPPALDPDQDARAALRSLVTDAIRFDVVDDGERIEGRRLDVDPRELRRLRHGRYAVDARLDLHGMTLAEARGRVTEFVRKRAGGGDRVVLIVHGKGHHSPGGQPVLRGEIGAWLGGGPAARHVLAFASAPEEDGGPGAVVALLAR